MYHLWVEGFRSRGVVLPLPFPDAIVSCDLLNDRASISQGPPSEAQMLTN